MTRVNPMQFAEALRIKVPQRILAHRNEFMFEVTAATHTELVRVTPVDTGYLVNGLSLTAGAEAPPEQPPRPANLRRGVRRFRAPSFDGTAIPRALAAGKSLFLSFQAAYAPFVEDRVHMVKRTKMRMTSIVRDAVKVVVGRNAA